MNGSCFNRSHRIIGSGWPVMPACFGQLRRRVDISLPGGLSCPIVQEIFCGLEGVWGPPCVSFKSASLIRRQTKPHCWEFPGSSLVRTLHPHCWSPRFIPWLGILQALLHSWNKTQPANNQTNPHCFPRTDSVEPWRLFCTAAAGWWAGPWAWIHQLGFQSQPCNLASCSLSFLITKTRMAMPSWWAVVMGEWDDACEDD